MFKKLLMRKLFSIIKGKAEEKSEGKKIILDKVNLHSKIITILKYL